MALENRSTLLEVESRLVPYQSTSVHGVTQGSLEQWNYEFYHSTSENLKLKNTSRGVSYEFSGSYGPDLLNEVNRYAEVAACVANDFSFDVIHAHDWMTYPAGIAAKKATGKPFIAHVHATEFDRSGENIHPAIFALEQQGFQEADRVVAVSQWTKKLIVDRFKIPEEKITVVHNGVVPRERKPATVLPPLGSPIVTFLGRVTHQKGPFYFVEAARSVLLEFPSARFVVVGSGDLLPLMIQRVAQLRMSSRFHFTGFLKNDKTDAIWSLTDVYVMPSVSEPFGITPLEAVQSGVPVIISNQSGVSEVISHAIKVDFWNNRSLASAICSILKYKSLSDTLKKKSKEELKKITWDNAAQQLNTIYNELKNPSLC